MDKIKAIEEEFIKKDIPSFDVGDTVRVITKIFEQDKVRYHPFEGIVIAKKGSGIRSSFTVRRVSYGEGIEQVFPLHSPYIERIEVLKSAPKRKRARLYYLRERIGKQATQVE
ncbi:MAG: 50S ribosomal protein L19 [Candidatus Omnitrophica bacterium]|nr:50S ribosomal protein L19 [Candidatus Omnitrophota bacterium]